MIKTLKDKKGFTLVEIMIVVAIIAILIAILVPALGGALKRVRESSTLQDAARAREAAQALATEAYAKYGAKATGSVSIGDIEEWLGVSFGDEATIIANYEVLGTGTPGALTKFIFINTKYKITVELTTDGKLEVINGELP